MASLADTVGGGRRNLGLSLSLNTEVEIEAPQADLIEAEDLAEMMTSNYGSKGGGGGEETDNDALDDGDDDGVDDDDSNAERQRSRKHGVIVIDVRDADFEGGNITGALSIPFSKLERHLPELVEQHGKSTTLVFHCMYSQERGPRAAAMMLNALCSAGGDADERSDVYVLKGGFHRWLNTWVEDPEECAALIENYEPKKWMYESERMQLVHQHDHPDTSLDVAIRRLSQRSIEAQQAAAAAAIAAALHLTIFF